MVSRDQTQKFDRRIFLAGSGALAMLDAGCAAAQEPAGKQPAGRELRQLLAEFVVAFDIKQVPPDVIELARLAVVDSIGVAVAGSHEEVAHIAVGMVKLEGAAPQCTVIGQSLRTSPQLAAFANGIAGHAMDYDFTYMSGQSAAPVLPALLAVAESIGATPAETLGAFIVGCEVSARIGRSNPLYSNVGGWHTTGVVGGICAAAACAKLMKLPVEKVAHAIGVSVSLASGVAVNYGTMTKPLHCGNAARNGVMAALLAREGFTSHPAAFEGDNGYFASFARALPSDYAPFQDLGKRWDLKEMGYSIKYYPCGGRGHTAIEAALMLRDKVSARLDDIANIHCWMSPSSAKRVNTQYPVDVEAAKFSAAYVLAYSLIHGAPKIKAFNEQALKDARVRALAGLTTASADPGLSDAFGESPTRVRITLKDGQTLTQQRDYATGSKQVPMTPAQVEEKFMDCAAQTISAEAAKKLFAFVGRLHERPAFGDFWTLIAKA